MMEYSTCEHVGSPINMHIVPRLGSLKLNSVTPLVVERFQDDMEADEAGGGLRPTYSAHSKGSCMTPLTRGDGGGSGGGVQEPCASSPATPRRAVVAQGAD